MPPKRKGKQATKKRSKKRRRRSKCRRNLPRLPMHLRPPADFLDTDARAMATLYYPRPHTPSPHFLRDPRLRTYARALLVVCLELDAPGTMKWWTVEPVRLPSTPLKQITSYHRLLGQTEFDHTHLTATFHRLRGALKRRAAHLRRRDLRVAKGGKMSKFHSGSPSIF